jgi:hypothetical protein
LCLRQELFQTPHVGGIKTVIFHARLLYFLLLLWCWPLAAEKIEKNIRNVRKL